MVSVQPLMSVTTNRTVKLPVVLYTCVGVVPVEVPPSPKVQKQLTYPTDELEKLTGSLIHGCTFDAAKSAVGLCTVTVTGPDESTQPIISAIHDRTRYVPAAVYTCVVVGTPNDAVLPSPKSQIKLLNVAPGTSVEVSVNTAVSGQHPDGGVILKPGRGSPTIT